MLLLDEKRLVVAVWEGLRSHFGSSRRKMVESQSNCANLKKAHFLDCHLTGARLPILDARERAVA